MYRHIFILVFLVFFIIGCEKNSVESNLSRAKEKALISDWQNALKFANKAVELEPNNVRALLVQAIALERNGNIRDAVEVAKQAVELSPKDFSAQLILGRIAAQDIANIKLATLSLRKAYMLDKSRPEPLIELINLEEKTGGNIALTYLKMLSNIPELSSDASINNNLAIEYIRNRDFNKGQRLLLANARYANENPLYLYNLARYLQTFARRPKDASKLYRKFLEITINSSDENIKKLRTKAAQRTRL